MSAPYARAGEVVTCTNGHPICEFAEDAALLDGQRPGHLTGWRQPEPLFGGPIPTCAVCGAEFYRGPGVFHFAEGWRMVRGGAR
ncbi:hypothetical protein [Azospirillum sp. ST 5-10]|uniref:hypothetical protein n=1 Tax=unclassified Azospirillum TaxID=2630922 RepID=UPI003F4A360B